MTCQCTCGKHILVEAKWNTSVQNVTAAPILYDVVLNQNTGAMQSLITFVRNTSCAGPIMPTGWPVKEVP